MTFVAKLRVSEKLQTLSGLYHLDRWAREQTFFSGMKPTKKEKVICIPEIGNTSIEVNFECCLFKDNYFRGIHKKIPELSQITQAFASFPYFPL